MKHHYQTIYFATLRNIQSRMALLHLHAQMCRLTDIIIYVLY